MEDLISKARASQQVITAQGSTVELLLDNKAMELLAEEEFSAGWDVLYSTCPWGTVFQSRPFVTAWYRIYHAVYQPVLVQEVVGGRLTGLLTLARDPSGLIVGAGDSQAEYQVWLAAADNADNFIRAALAKIRQHFPGGAIRLKYVPGHTPLDWIARDKTWQPRCMLRASKQPLIRIDEASIALELKKKNRREKINRLKRMGELTFERVTDSQEFAAIFNELATQYDFRKGAMFNRTFFLDDPLRKEFLLALFRQGLLHATLLKLNDEIIASNVGVTGKNWVHLQGINTHAPLYSRYSPGILHFLMLGKLLAEEGIEVFDLTPGSDSYKETLATDFCLAYELNIGSPYSRITNKIKRQLIQQIKISSSRIGVSPIALKKLKREIRLIKEKIQNSRQHGLKSMVNEIFSQARTEKTIRTYLAKVNNNPGPSAASIPIRRSSLADLLHYDQRGGGQTRWEFLADAMRRFELGDQSYTWSEEGRLLACAWLCAQQPAISQNLPQPTLPEGAILLDGFYYHPAIKEQLQSFLKEVTIEVTRSQEIATIVAVVRGRDTTAESLEALGFRELKPG